MVKTSINYNILILQILIIHHAKPPLLYVYYKIVSNIDFDTKYKLLYNKLYNSIRSNEYKNLIINQFQSIIIIIIF